MSTTSLTLCLACLFSLTAGQSYGSVWRENFQNLDNWVVQIEDGASTGNNEWEYYTNSPDNVYLVPNSQTGGNSLVLQALNQPFNGYNYTSGKVYSAQMFGPYGFFNVRATVPKGNGLWPAIWLLPFTTTPYGTWAACGEIDFMETVCNDPNSYSTLHFGGPWPQNVQGPSNNVFPMSIDWTQPHNFGVEWQPTYIRFWFDSEVVNGEIQGTNFNEVTSDQWYSMNSDGVNYPGNAPFNTPFNIILNVAIGGGWPCSVPGCCDNIAVPAQMIVDFVEVWEMVFSENKNTMADKKSGASGKTQGAYGFDPSGLERAAKAAKELDNSPNAKNAFELAMKQEDTTKTKSEARVKELDIQRIQIEHSERRKTLETELEVAKMKSKFDDELARRRYQEQLDQHARMQEMNRKRDEESILKQEAMKRQTIQYETELKRENDRIRVLSREQAKIQRLKETKDMRQEEMILKEQERRKTLRELWTANLQAIGSGTREYLSNFNNLAALAGGLTLMFFGFQFARAAGRITTAIVEARVGKPPLIRETSRKTSVGQHLAAPLATFYSHTLVKGRMLPTSAKQREKDILDGIFINEDLERNLRTISHSIVNRKRHYAPFRNLLLYGPPGTGKTMFAKSLASHSGMDFAIFTGGDIGPLGKDGTTQLHKLFDWANTSRKGVLLFMDEADAFLRKRNEEHISEDMRNALNAFLFRTGSGSHKFMLVLASNAPEQLDRAAHDRIDEIVCFDRPGHKQRLQMLYHYLLIYCSPPKDVKSRLKQYIEHPRSLIYKKTDIGMKGVEAEFIEEVTKDIEGFSGREIYKLVIAWHDAAFSQENAILTPEVMKEVLQNHIVQHKQREEWHQKKTILS